jgi:hypothetical protein
MEGIKFETVVFYFHFKNNRISGGSLGHHSPRLVLYPQIFLHAVPHWQNEENLWNITSFMI